MTERPRKLPGELAQEHWDWLAPIIAKIPLTGRDDDFLAYLFTTAMIHGAKHGKEGDLV